VVACVCRDAAFSRPKIVPPSQLSSIAVRSDPILSADVDEARYPPVQPIALQQFSNPSICESVTIPSLQIRHLLPELLPPRRKSVTSPTSLHIGSIYAPTLSPVAVYRSTTLTIMAIPKARRIRSRRPSAGRAPSPKKASSNLAFAKRVASAQICFSSPANARRPLREHIFGVFEIG
jgi:hypothetical protein